jgi:hypothetical protein
MKAAGANVDRTTSEERMKKYLKPYVTPDKTKLMLPDNVIVDIKKRSNDSGRYVWDNVVIIDNKPSDVIFYVYCAAMVDNNKNVGFVTWEVNGKKYSALIDYQNITEGLTLDVLSTYFVKNR